MLDREVVMRKVFLIVLVTAICSVVYSRNDLKNDPRNNGELALWIDDKQVKMFSGVYTFIY